MITSTRKFSQLGIKLTRLFLILISSYSIATHSKLIDILRGLHLLILLRNQDNQYLKLMSLKMSKKNFIH